MTSRPPHIRFDRDKTENQQPELGVPFASETKERFRSVVESSADGILVHRDGKFLYANSFALKMYAAESLEQLQTRTVVDLIYPEDRDAIRARMQQGYEGQMVPWRETKELTLDGRVTEVEKTGSRIMYQGEPAVQIIIRDITERKQKASELERFNRTLKALSTAARL